MPRIFISIASYRDAQLIPTIQDCIAQAAYPNDLVFGICQQYGPGEEVALSGEPVVRALNVPCAESQGCCWARAEIMKLYDGEEWFFQIDSHMRFTPRWDEKLRHWAERSGAAKPLITTYGTVFNVGPPDTREAVPYRMNFDYFAAGIPLFRPGELDGWRAMTRPTRARFLSAHLLFVPGWFVEEVPYDPDLYFHGEEMSLAVRAFTHGYDLFHPPEIILWHEYTRAYRRKHWDDHPEGHPTSDWTARNRAAEEKVRNLLQHPQIGRFALGDQRTLAHYEAWAGLDFTAQTVTAQTARFEEPPAFPGCAGADVL